MNNGDFTMNNEDFTMNPNLKILEWVRILVIGLMVSFVVYADDIDIEGGIQALDSNSVTVQGITFLVDSDTDIEGPNGNETFNDLFVGLYVEIEGEDQGSGIYLADEIDFDDEIEIDGVIQGINTNSLVVLDIEIFVDANTEIKDDDGIISFSDLTIGDYVEVEADLLADSSYLASEIEREDDESDIEVEGVIDSVGQDELVVNGIRFLVDSNTVIVDDDDNPLSFSDLQVGDEVEVEANEIGSGDYLAVKIELDDDRFDDIEVEGLIDSLGSDFLVVNNLLFLVDSNTIVEDDDDNIISFSDLQVGDKVEVDGRQLSNGDLLATHIELEDDQNDEIEITAPIDSLFTDGLVVSGVFFEVDNNTQIRDDDDNPISFSDLQVGMLVEIDGDIRPDGSVIATEIEIEDFFQDELEITGLVDSLASDLIVVQGIEFIVTSQTIVLDDDNNPIQYSDLMPGMLVEIRADLPNGGQPVANRIKIEDDDEDDIELTVSISSLGNNQIFAAGLVFDVNANTLYLDNFGNPITFSDLAAGQQVEIKAVQQANGALLALRVKIEDQPGFTQLTGKVSSVSGNSIQVLQSLFQVTSQVVVLDEQYQPISYGEISQGHTINVWADQSSGSGTAIQIRILERGVLSGVDTGQLLPESFVLEQNYPNPFNPSTTIPLEIREIGWKSVQVLVYDMLGKKVRTIYDGALNNGRYEFTWNGSSDLGNPVSSGIYFYQFIVDSKLVSTRRMVLMK